MIWANFRAVLWWTVTIVRNTSTFYSLLNFKKIMFNLFSHICHVCVFFNVQKNQSSVLTTNNNSVRERCLHLLVNLCGRKFMGVSFQLFLNRFELQNVSSVSTDEKYFPRRNRTGGSTTYKTNPGSVRVGGHLTSNHPHSHPRGVVAWSSWMVFSHQTRG